MRQKHGRFNHYLWHSILDLPWAKSAQDPTIEPLLVDGKMARTCFPKKGRG
jgi:hypothetical protein